MDVSTFEDFSNKLSESKDNYLTWKECTNTLLISEDSLQRTLTVIQNSSFAILTAYQNRFSKRDNILRNRKLRAFLNQNRMGVHQLVGHYEEVQPDGLTVDVIERSYLVEKPDDMSDKDFADIIVGCLTIDGITQNCALIRFESRPNKYYLIDSNSQITLIGTKLTIGKIGKIYSQHVKKLNVPFKFEGEEIPGSNLGRLGYSKNGYAWGGHNGFGY